MKELHLIEHVSI